jgi:uncharacterized protein (TIGR00290 family)
LQVNCLLNFVHQDQDKFMAHGLAPEIISLQAQAMGLPVLQPRVTWGTYEAGFNSAFTELKSQGVTGLITGDIHLREHRDWLERVCGNNDIELVMPLWQIDTSKLLHEFIDAGFKAVIVSVKSALLGKDWLNKNVDAALAEEIDRLKETLAIDPMGESGEFHTFVYDGPPFKQAIQINKATPVERDDHWFLDITDYSLGSIKKEDR